MNIFDWILVIFLFLWLAAAVYAMLRGRRGGSCCGNCHACGLCPQAQKKRARICRKRQNHSA